MSQGNDLISRDKAIELVARVCAGIMLGCKTYFDEEVNDNVYDDIREVDAILKCNKAIRKMLRELPAEPRWIPCKEKLPEPGERVLVCDKCRRIDVSCIIYITSVKDGDLVESRLWGPTTFFDNDEIVAWMPLPEGFKVTSDGD